MYVLALLHSALFWRLEGHPSDVFIGLFVYLCVGVRRFKVVCVFMFICFAQMSHDVTFEFVICKCMTKLSV